MSDLFMYSLPYYVSRFSYVVECKVYTCEFSTLKLGMVLIIKLLSDSYWVLFGVQILLESTFWTQYATDLQP